MVKKNYKLNWYNTDIDLVILLLELISKLKYNDLSCPHVVSGHPEGIKKTGFPPSREWLWVVYLS